MIQSKGTPHEQVNPPYTPYLWVDLTNGEIYTCVDNTRDANVWVGQSGSFVGNLPIGADIESELVYHLGPPSGTIATAIVGDDFTLTSNYGYGVSNETYHFNYGEYITCTDDFFSRPVYSVSVFASTTDIRDIGADGRRTIFSDNANESRLEFNGSGGVTFAVDDGSHTFPMINTESNFIEEVTEYHIVCTYANGTSQIYINGILKASGSLATTPSTGTTNTWIGRSVDSDRYLRGTIRDFRVYNRILTETDVYGLYFNGIRP